MDKQAETTNQIKKFSKAASECLRVVLENSRQIKERHGVKLK